MESVDGRTQVQRVYQLILDDPDWTPERLQAKLGITHTEVSAALSLMRDLGLLERDELAPSGMAARSAEAALVNLLREQKTTLSARVDELQRTSAALDTLASQFLSLRNPRPSDTRVDIVVGDDEVTALLRDATAVAYHEVLVLGMDFPGRCADTEFGSSWHRRIIGNGVRMRAVHLCSMARSMRAANRLRMLQRDGVDIRLTPSAPVSIMTFDHFLTIAAIPAFQGTTAVLAIHGHALTGLFRHVFDWCWATSAALGSEALDPPAPQDLSEQQKAVVRMLAAGMKDETIARNLGISQRTLRRLITELMEVLESGSRFQAGVKAAALGWVPASGV
ncbi:LuxR C-terminal-related transcriptional regulator [Microbispora sp. H11081]|uniref:helix-turn-helix transcriptional regulator n=1 Tax=Microbispora sp. H11081 TaxID=2729107 RepID=UPI0014766641|nr:LuxR C-terminal-related transcriptional regulator [Microbispora sp. H11081]